MNRNLESYRDQSTNIMASLDPATTDVISRLRTLYFAMIPLRRYPSRLAPSVLALLSASYELSSRFLDGVLDATVRNPLGDRFPIAYAARVAFLKWLIGLVEKRSIAEEEEEVEDANFNIDNAGMSDDSDDPYDALFTLYADSLTSAGSIVNPKADESNSDYCFKTYFYPPHVRVSLHESRNFVSSGTTGLTSWTASFFMIDWMEKTIAKSSDSSSFLSGKNVLELGSGTGLAGIYACLRTASTGSGMKSFRFSDCHPTVLATLRRNVSNNLPSSNDVGVVALDWSEDVTGKTAESAMDSGEGVEEERNDRLDASWFPDVILGCDIVFDVDVIPYLVRLLKHFLSREANSSDRFSLKNPPCAFVASTVRNQLTYQLFLSQLAEAGLVHETISSTTSSNFSPSFSTSAANSTRDDSSFRYVEACLDENPIVEIIHIQNGKLRDEMELSVTYMPRMIANELTEMKLS